MQAVTFSPAMEDRIQTFGKQLIEHVRRSAAAAPQGWLDALIARAIQDPGFRVQTLRFVDVLPTLHQDADLVAHLKEYFHDMELPWPAISNWGLRHSDSPWAQRIAAPLVRATLRGLSRRFMGGSNLHLAMATITRLHGKGMQYSLDLLGEAVVSEHEADVYQQAYLDLLAGLAQFHTVNEQHSNNPPRPHIALKLSSLYSRINPIDPDGSVAGICTRLRPILTAARQCSACVTIDMEQYDFRHVVMQCFMQVLLEAEYRDWPDAGIAMQTYLKDSPDSLQQLIDWADERGTPVFVRLVRGAYWDYETVVARQHGWELPVWEHKAQTDATFEACLELLFMHHRNVRPSVATHNVRSLACAIALAEQHGLTANDYEFEMLYGMADDLKQALVDSGYHLRIYVPYGETLPGMAYLVRRLLENTSGQTILDAGMGVADISEIQLKRPIPWIADTRRTPPPRFQNQSLHRFTRDDERALFRQAIASVEQSVGADYPLIINGTAVSGEQQIISTNPSAPHELIGRVAMAGQRQAEQAVKAARASVRSWQALSAAERAGHLRNIAAALTRERNQFAAWQVLEAGKHWREADADVCEALDFLHYYADQAERLALDKVVELNGEHNALGYRPRGVGLVIAPWNFPLAILTGMLSATIVCGNTAIVKPSSLTPVIAARFVDLMHAAGLPPGVVNFLPGPGEEVGAWLAAHPGIDIIAFTGSRAVGTQLLATAARIAPGQQYIKRVIAEMGGKNAIIIDDDANLDDAIPGVVQSAFGYQGQKCSAASRVIVVGDIYDTVVTRLHEATNSLIIGDPRHPGNDIGPVIDATARQRIQTVIEQGAQRARLITARRDDLPDTGHYLTPSIFTAVHPNDPLAQEEIFGPVMVVLRARNFEHALTIANSTPYALTGGVYSRRPSHLEQARHDFQVGNLYLNRGITGALVARQPFGGFRMSGMGSKAGGPDYLKQFMDPVCITENTLRRGFAPKIDDG
jgi:RHH-type proline utilization regulon transcriptional repressor/proline dehydrogenase/delta 1-pyrroline-5-carboxylate dehydrogenase